MLKEYIYVDIHIYIYKLWTDTQNWWVISCDTKWGASMDKVSKLWRKTYFLYICMFFKIWWYMMYSKIKELNFLKVIYLCVWKRERKERWRKRGKKKKLEAKENKVVRRYLRILQGTQNSMVRRPGSKVRLRSQFLSNNYWLEGIKYVTYYLFTLAFLLVKGR